LVLIFVGFFGMYFLEHKIKSVIISYLFITTHMIHLLRLNPVSWFFSIPPHSFTSDFML
jgi:hypothetical protein